MWQICSCKFAIGIVCAVAMDPQQATLGSNDRGFASILSPTTKSRQMWRSYAREEKLAIVSFYQESGNLYRTCQCFDINSKNVLCWIEQGRRSRRAK